MIQSFFYCCVRLGLPSLFFSTVNAKIYVSVNIHGIMALKILLLSMQNQMNLFQNTYEQDIFTNQACFIWLISQWNPLSCTSHHCHTYVEMDNIAGHFFSDCKQHILSFMCCAVSLMKLLISVATGLALLQRSLASSCVSSMEPRVWNGGQHALLNKLSNI